MPVGQLGPCRRASTVRRGQPVVSGSSCLSHHVIFYARQCYLSVLHVETDAINSAGLNSLKRLDWVDAVGRCSCGVGSRDSLQLLYRPRVIVVPCLSPCIGNGNMQLSPNLPVYRRIPGRWSSNGSCTRYGGVRDLPNCPTDLLEIFFYLRPQPSLVFHDEIAQSQ